MKYLGSVFREILPILEHAEGFEKTRGDVHVASGELYLELGGEPVGLLYWDTESEQWVFDTEGRPE